MKVVQGLIRPYKRFWAQSLNLLTQALSGFEQTPGRWKQTVFSRLIRGMLQIWSIGFFGFKEWGSCPKSPWCQNMRLIKCVLGGATNTATATCTGHFSKHDLFCDNVYLEYRAIIFRPFWKSLPNCRSKLSTKCATDSIILPPTCFSTLLKKGKG